MCLITIKLPNTERESKENFQLIHELNKDGIGVAFNQNNFENGEFSKKLVVRRGFASLDEFYDYYLAIPADSTILVHFRKCSCGAINEENLHPFTVNENLCFAFNGTISSLDFKTDKSDTFVFNNLYIQPLLAVDKLLYKKYCFRRVIESYINNAKMVMLDNLGEFVIFNESLGFWNEEGRNDEKLRHTWYSNELWKKKEANPNSSNGGKKKYTRGFIKDNCNIKNQQGQLALPNPSFYSQNSKDSKESKNSKGLDDLGNLNLKNHKLGSPESIKKKYYLVGDPYYSELSLDELKALSIKYNRGLRKLKKRLRIIADLEDVPENLRFQGWMKKYQKEVQDENEAARKVIDETIEELNKKEPAPAQLPLTSSIGEMLNDKISDKISNK